MRWPDVKLAPLDRRYGTYRGLLRLALAEAEFRIGRLQDYTQLRPAPVRRLVFVCRGNICRSAYAHRRALALSLPSASLGLSAATGAGVPPEALDAAAELGTDLSGHRATDLSDFAILPGDLLLAMETRQARALQRRLADRPSAGDDAQVALLGHWARPRRLHLHDPFRLRPEYFRRCFAAIDGALLRLADTLAQNGNTFFAINPRSTSSGRGSRHSQT